MFVEMMEDFIDSYSWLTTHRPNENDNAWKQLRAIFTTWTIYNDVEADTMECDRLLWRLYRKLYGDDSDYSYDDFENFMLTDII